MVTFPEFLDVHEKDHFRVTINKVQKLHLAEMNEEFIKKNSNNEATNDGFHIAAGFVNLENNDPSAGLIEDPEVGTVKFFFKSWDIYDPVT